jgi:hypothetical protein
VGVAITEFMFWALALCQVFSFLHLILRVEPSRFTHLSHNEMEVQRG